MLTLDSPAKINLFLRILGRRPDGYHDLASLFQVVDLCDTIHFAIDKEDSLSCDNADVPTDRSNLILQAANLFRAKTGRKFGVRVKLDKRIPICSGLGGGSSNAATTLWALNKLLGEPVSMEQLREWSGDIGADVPFFFSQGTAYCMGKGDVFTSLPEPSPQKLWLVKPDQGLQTPAIFQRLCHDEVVDSDPEEILRSHLEGAPVYCNDLEDSAFALYPKLALIKERMLSAGFRAVAMTGSGSALFCVGDSSPPSFPDVWSCHVSYLNRPNDRWYGA